MSRSYKKSPIIKESGNSKKERKIVANSVVRGQLKLDDEEQSQVANGKAYKKLFESWEISDYKTICTEPEARQMYEKWSQNDEKFRRKYPTVDVFINKWWKKHYKRK